MTTHELARMLLAGPDVRAIVRGYEGGYNNVLKLVPREIAINVEPSGLFGCHEDNDDEHFDAVIENAVEVWGTNDYDPYGGVENDS